MRAGIGLLSLLIAIAIIFYISFGMGGRGYEGQVLDAGKTARDQANQLGGKDENGMKAEDSIVMDEIMNGSELRRLKVTSLVAGGPMQKAYGLMPGDEIIQADQLELRGQDPGMAKSLVFSGYGQNMPLVIDRNGQQMTLNPDTAITKAHPGDFAKPGSILNPNSIPNSSSIPTVPSQAVPTH
jgi:hypothetical protein